MIVVDTNVVSELMSPARDDAVADWVRAHDNDDLHTTVVTVAEIHYGIERLAAGRRKERLRAAAADCFDTFAHRVLPVDIAAAYRFGEIVAGRNSAGRPIDAFDALIASICASRRAALATRNTKDFDGTGISLVNPWLPA